MRNERNDPLYFVKFTSNEVEEAAEYEERRKRIAEERQLKNRQAIIYSRMRFAKIVTLLISGVGCSVVFFWGLVICRLMG